jgi:hypothetical protein
MKIFPALVLLFSFIITSCNNNNSTNELSAKIDELITIIEQITPESDRSENLIINLNGFGDIIFGASVNEVAYATSHLSPSVMSEVIYYSNVPFLSKK